MKTLHLIKLGTLMLIAMLSTSPVLADKPDWAGGGKGEKHGKKHDSRDGDERGKGKGGPNRASGSSGSSVQISFGASDRRVVSDYFGSQYSSGKCPPGLAKKNNGCMPPGQAKKWSRGAPLPRDLHYYDLPRDLLIRLPVPPAGQRYVRIAGDILLIAIGTNMVLDAIEDLGR